MWETFCYFSCFFQSQSACLAIISFPLGPSLSVDIILSNYVSLLAKEKHKGPSKYDISTIQGGGGHNTFFTDNLLSLGFHRSRI